VPPPYAGQLRGARGGWPPSCAPGASWGLPQWPTIQPRLHNCLSSKFAHREILWQAWRDLGIHFWWRLPRMSTATMPVTTEPMSRREVLESLSGLLLVLFVALISSTIVSTALPRIIGALHG